MNTHQVRGLILSVGISPEPILYTLQRFRPQYVAAITTAQSRKILDQVVAGYPLSPSQLQVAQVTDSPQSIGTLILKVYELYRWLIDTCGLRNDQIAIDPTPGRKWMSAGVTMLASQLGLEMFYVDAQYDQQTRKVIPESMQLVQLGNAFEQTGFLTAQRGREHFNLGQFAAAARAWNSIKPIRAQERSLYQGLAQLAHALHRWDLFEHYNQSLMSQFQEAFTKLAEYTHGVGGATQLEQFVQQMQTLAQTIEQVTQATKPALEATADLLVNARRRIDQGQYDDACARLYRALESVAQYLLKDRYQLDVSRPDWQNQSQAIRQAAQEVFQGQLPDQLALYQAWGLLWALQDPAARNILFPGRNNTLHFKFQPLLELRNNSILAHGWIAINKEDVNDLADQVQQALTNSQPELARWIKNLTVPTLPELPLTRP